MNDHEHEPWAIFERSVPGWFRVTAVDDGPELYVGAVIGSSGKPVITGLAFAGRPLLAAHLREVPLRRIEARLAQPPLIDWVKRAPAKRGPLRELQEVADEGPDFVYERELRPRLARPNGQDIAAFYLQVAAAYREYIQHSRRPAVEIATEAGVPVATARRWINRARELGLLEKGQRGRAI